MFRLTAWALILAVALSAEEWQECRTGPFEIWTNGSDRAARELLVRLEQIRHVLGGYLGKQDPVSVWTIRAAMELTTILNGQKPQRFL